MAVTEDSLKENSDTSVQAEAGLQVQSDSAAAEVNDTSGEVLKPGMTGTVFRCVCLLGHTNSIPCLLEAFCFRFFRLLE